MGSSNYRTLEEIHRSREQKKLTTQALPNHVEWRSGSPALIRFSDSSIGMGSCIRCADAPCIEYSASEFTLDEFVDFPADANLLVCPSKAISWPQDSDSPTIDSEACISCGICVGRCPVSAIWLNQELLAVVNDEPNQHFVAAEELATAEEQNSLISKFCNISANGLYVQESDDLIQYWYERFQEIASRQSAQFPNHLVRNLLMAIGISALMRRRGDTNIRMDVVFGQTGGKIGTCEVELGSGVLDAPRNILDNVAVLVSRYGHKKKSIIPLIISLSLPNQRSEYWRVIKDINEVLDVRVNSLTIGILVLMVWNRLMIPLDSLELFYGDSDSPSLKNQVEAQLDRQLNILSGYPGFLENMK